MPRNKSRHSSIAREGVETIAVALILLLAVVVSGALARMSPIALPVPLVQIAIGALIAAVADLGVELKPDIFFLLFLPPLLFLDGWRIPKEGLFRDKGTILELAFGLVVFTVIGVGYFVNWLVPAMPLAVAFALAAIISPTDPIAVSAIAARVPIPRRLMHVLEGESLLNDASGLVCMQFAVAATLTGSFSATAALGTFLWLAIGGVGIGVGVIVFGAAMGGLYAVAYVLACGRTGNLRPRTLALLVALGGFLGFYLIPFIKYPANPPAIGHEDTIRDRGALYLITVAVSCLALFLAVYAGQRLYRRLSLYRSVLIAALGYAVVMGVLFWILPPLGHLHANVVEYGKHATETPLPLEDANGHLVFPGFPADLLARFRVYSLLNQVILWGGIALLFAPQAQRLLDPAAAKAAKESRFVEDHTPVAV